MSWQSVLPVLIVLACPLMMIFMMRGHSHGGHMHTGTGFDGMSDEQLEELARRAHRELEDRQQDEQSHAS